MKLKLLSAATLITLANFSQTSLASEFDVSANATIVSQDVFRGVDASQEDPAFQGDITAENGGFSFGAGASTYDFGGSDDGIELDLIVGYKMPINDDFSIGFGLTEYTYSGTSSSTTEFNIIFDISNFAIGLYSDVDLDTEYLSVDTDFALADDLSLKLHVGNADSETDFAVGIDYKIVEQFSVFATVTEHTADAIGGNFLIGGTYSF